MPFSARNARYLRISAHTVLPLYIYLDDKHLEWMSDYILQHVLADLRPDIGPKLRMESGFNGPGGSAHAKKGTVAVHRGDTYQFAYFFRKNEPHAVLIKSRMFVPAPPPASLPVPITQPQQLPAPTRKKRKRGETGNKNATNRTGKRKDSQRNQEDPAVTAREVDSEDARNSSGGIEGPRRSLRTNNLVCGTYKEVDEEGSDIEMTETLSTDRHTQPADDATQGIRDKANLASSTQRTQQPVLQEVGVSRSAMASEPEPGFSQPFDIIEEEEEEKPKMAMKVSYQGFTIYDRCLCVVIEPWPPLRDSSRMLSRAPSLTLNETRMGSVPPMEQRGQTPVPLRERTPLFLPEIDPRRSLTPAPLPARILPPVPLFDDPSDPDDGGEDTGDGMMAFSQVLKSVGGERAGSVDEDANEGDAFLGDADERRGDL